ncbi:MAG: UdgX family uracil-DNA binding protein [Bryobacteraceae bacterium]
MREILTENFAQWRTQARDILRQSIPPEQVHFTSPQLGQPLLPFEPAAESESAVSTAKVPREFLELAEKVACFRDPDRWNSLYQVLWRLTHGQSHLLKDHADPQIRQLRIMEKAVGRDMHKMRAFVRFREAPGPVFVAWYRPEHYIVRANAPFFARRFGSIDWAILTPDESVYWDQKELRFGPGLPREAAPSDDRIEDLWLTYYASIFNPARVNLAAMTAEMPVRHWGTLPEATLISNLLHHADERVVSMVRKQPTSAKPFVPPDGSLKELAEAARTCQGCELYLHTTQTVFGEGPESPKVMFVGEQPGDQEDLAGSPFVGPAGKILDKALQDAGIDRDSVYVTNAVKHFRFEERGKRRIHKKPGGGHISACRPWLEAELGRLKPETIVCLGATAAQSLVGRDVRILQDRGKWMSTLWAKRLMVTIHPSALLRLPETSSYEEEYERFVRDLRQVVG